MNDLIIGLCLFCFGFPKYPNWNYTLTAGTNLQKVFRLQQELGLGVALMDKIKVQRNDIINCSQTDSETSICGHLPTVNPFPRNVVVSDGPLLYIFCYLCASLLGYLHRPRR